MAEERREGVCHVLHEIRRPKKSRLLPPCSQVEDPKKALLLYGGRTSQTVKDVLADFGKLKGVRAVCEM